MKKIFILTLLSIISIFPSIIDTDDLHSIKKHTTAGSLIVWDIDNTIAHPSPVLNGNHIGSDQWFSYMVQKEADKGKSKDAAIKGILPLYYYIQHVTPLTPVHESTPDLISALQEIENVHVVGLTARSLPLVDRTAEQLQEIKIAFDKKNLFPPNLVLTLNNSAMCKHGIIFCGNNDKGKVLYSFCQCAQYVPKKIIAIDDKERNLTSIKKTCDRHGIEFLGIRYSGADQHVQAFDSKKSQHHLEEFLKKQMTWTEN